MNWKCLILGFFGAVLGLIALVAVSLGFVWFFETFSSPKIGFAIAVATLIGIFWNIFYQACK